MTLRRATLYIGGGTLLVAWFSSAASLSLGRGARPVSVADRDATSPAQALAVSVQTQARRLQQRLATAPTPQQPVRNPFAFRPLPVVRQTPTAAPAEPEPESAPVPTVIEPPLVLVGLGERRTGDTLVRSAMISSEGQDLILAEVGTAILGRYTVSAIGSDAVEMTDAVTGGVRRLILQNP
jgi:hypothetical protein